jgi:phytoene dehydrogenase-like protein
MSPDPDLIIIGAGIAGLAAGCYAQMNGYQSLILEMHHLPGGLCTAWERKGYTFDGCIHYLFGSAPGQPFHRLWEDLGAVQGRRFIHHRELMRIQDGAGRELIVYTDPDQLEAHLCALSPQDAALSRAFCAGVRTFTRFDLSRLQQVPKEQLGLGGWARLGTTMLPFLPALAQWGMVSAAEFASRFRDPFLRRAIPQMFAWSDIPVMVGMSLLAYMHLGNAGFPVGASLAFARAIEQRYRDLGGQISYRAQVARILVDEDHAPHRAVGVRLYTNEELRARRGVIAACDGRATLFDLLDGRYLNRELRRMYAPGALPVHSQLQVSLGVARDLSAEPHWTTYLLDQPLEIAGEERCELNVKHYGFDPSLAPAGKSALVAMLTSPYSYWQRIYGRTLYDHEQEQEAQVLVDWLARRYPGLRDQIEIMDVATPLSYERYTGNWQGSSCGWLLTKQTMGLMLKGVPKQLPGLKRLYLAGQWVEPGGSVPVVALSGRNAIQTICAEDGRAFGARD